jgi:hypothetical protein
MNGLASNGVGLDAFITRAAHTDKDCTVTMTWDGTGAFLDNQPVPGDILEIVEAGQQLWIGIVDQINNFNEERGNRIINLVARSRDGVGPWRSKRFTSQRFVQGASLTAVAETILIQQGLSPEEYIVSIGGQTVPHSNVQFSDTTPWAALETLGVAMGRSPFTDAKGRIKFQQRDVDRVADLVLTNELVKAIKGGKGTNPLTGYRLKWLDRNLTEVVQQSQRLASTSITAGFFKREQERKLFWSDDKRARAKNTYMKILQSTNDGLLPVGTEDYTEIDRFSGLIEQETSIFVAGLAVASLAALLALDATPDGVVVFGFGGSSGVTVPNGRIIHGVAEASILLIMMSMGVGQYEVWGEPYDFVHNVNQTEAFDDVAQYWQENVVVEANDLIFDETHAQEVVVRELLHRIAKSNRWDTVIVDDPRIEPGDIIELPDTSRLFVTGYQRDLTRGSESELKVSGFRS